MPEVIRLITSAEIAVLFPSVSTVRTVPTVMSESSASSDFSEVIEAFLNSNVTLSLPAVKVLKPLSPSGFLGGVPCEEPRFYRKRVAWGNSVF